TATHWPTAPTCGHARSRSPPTPRPIFRSAATPCASTSETTTPTSSSPMRQSCGRGSPHLREHTARDTPGESMPKGYLILPEAIHDRAGMDAYAGTSGAAIREFGGRVLVATDELEGRY